MTSQSVGDLAAFFFEHLLHIEISRRGNSMEQPEHHVIMDKMETARQDDLGKERVKLSKLDEVPSYTKYSANKTLGC